jgi:hypothetical protein
MDELLPATMDNLKRLIASSHELLPATMDNPVRLIACFAAVLLARVIGESVKHKYKWAPHLPKGEWAEGRTWLTSFFPLLSSGLL